MFKGLKEENAEYSNELEIMGASQQQSREGQTRGLHSVKLIGN